MDEVNVYTDVDTPEKTKKESIKSCLASLVIRSWEDKLDTILFHVSGQNHYMRHRCMNDLLTDKTQPHIIPIDYEIQGGITDEDLAGQFQLMNPKTKIICVFDMCLPRPFIQLRYKWDGRICYEQDNRWSKIKSQVVIVYGCLDPIVLMQQKRNRNTKENNSCLTIALYKVMESTNIKSKFFNLISKLRLQLAFIGSQQDIEVESSYKISENQEFL